MKVVDIYRKHATCTFSIGGWHLVNIQRDQDLFLEYLQHEVESCWIDSVTGNAYITLKEDHNEHVKKFG